MLEFMNKLDFNLTNSIDAFKNQTKKIPNSTDLKQLYNVIQKNNRNLYTYLELLKSLEIEVFSTSNNVLKSALEKQEAMRENALKREEEEKVNQFLFSFNVDNEIYNKDFKQRFIQDNKVSINLHKLNIKGVQDYGKDYGKDYGIDKKMIQILDTVNLGQNSLNLPIIKDLKNMIPMLHWYEGDNFHKSGIYVCMAPGFVARVPFPSVVSSNNINYKAYSIPCKHETRDLCNRHKKKISDIYSSPVRECMYVHKKEKFEKIGSIYRCNIESFGNHQSLDYDMNYIGITDIKRILMNSLSDTLLSVLWYQNKFKDGNLLLNNLEIY
jgi:hypothetical protein